MSATPEAVEEVLAKLAKDIESAVHALYRRQVGPSTAQVRTEHFVADARERIAAFLKSSPAPSTSGAQPRFTQALVPSAPPGDAGTGWTVDEAAAVTKCIVAWLPAWSPSSAKPDARCMAPGRELIPTWGERELARQAARKIQTS